MTSSEIIALIKKENKKNLPLRIFAWVNILVAFFLAFYILKVGICETLGAQLEGTLTLLVLPEPLNEMGEKEGAEPKEEKTSEEDQEEGKINQVNPALLEKQKQWASLFSAYAQKIIVKQTDLIHEINFNIDPKTPLPLNQGEVDIAFEVYDKDKEYLFTFYANYWNEDGYDEGEYWHESTYSESVYTQFPYAGEFYIVAGIPQRNTEMYQKIQEHSNGRVQVSFYSNSKPFPASSAFGMILFIIIAVILIVLRKRLSGEPPVYPFNFIYANPDFKNYYYVAISKGEYYLVNGIIKKEKKYNSFELILDKEGSASYLELEQETEDGETEYYAYHYNEFPEDDFPKIPHADSFLYRQITFKRSSNGEEPVKNTILYANGLSEEVMKTEIVYESSASNPGYICFEYGEDPEDFDVCYAANSIAVPMFRRIQK